MSKAARSALIEFPPVEEETGFCVEEVFDVDEKLSLGFFDVMRPIEKLADLGERKLV